MDDVSRRQPPPNALKITAASIRQIFGACTRSPPWNLPLNDARSSTEREVKMPDTATVIQVESRGRLRNTVRIVLPVGFLLLACWLLYRELSHYHVRDILDELTVLSRKRIGLACTCAILAYLVLAGYDWLGFRYIKHPLALDKIVSASFISYALSYNLGYAVLTGSSVRYRLYSAWGLAPPDIARVIIFCVMTFWVGLIAIAGTVCLYEPATVAAAFRMPDAWIQPVGVALLLLVAAYLVWSATQSRSLRIRGWVIAPPVLWISLAQITVTVLDLILAGTVLYILLPDNVGLSYVGVISVYLIAVILGLASQVPGGLGIFEAAVVHLLPTDIPPPTVMGALIAYRGVFYLFPLLIALLLLGGHELWIRLTRRERQR
jgi:uncharacterized membrane protein YbhN (UPF0104 family)